MDSETVSQKSKAQWFDNNSWETCRQENVYSGAVRLRFREKNETVFRSRFPQNCLEQQSSTKSKLSVVSCHPHPVIFFHCDAALILRSTLASHAHIPDFPVRWLTYPLFDCICFRSFIHLCISCVQHSALLLHSSQ